MRLRDVTAPMRPGMPVYDGDPEVTVRRVSSIGDGAPSNLSLYSFGSHTGTHVDPPRHFFDGGAAADELPLELLIGPARVIETVQDVIDRAALSSSGLEGVERLILKTSGPAGTVPGTGLDDGPVHLSADAAGYLVELGVRLVGIDRMSVERADGADFAAHRTLLGNGVVIVEGLDLSGVPPGEYELICLPLKVAGGDGAPARVVLRDIAG